jgi:hypothetical protein
MFLDLRILEAVSRVVDLAFLVALMPQYPALNTEQLTAVQAH